MLSAEKLNKVMKESDVAFEQVAAKLIRTGLNVKQAGSAIRNWRKGLLKPKPTSADIDNLAAAFGVERYELEVWHASHQFAPIAPRKARLVVDLIRGRSVQDAMDVLKFANKRAAVMVDKVLRSAVASADSQEVDVEGLYVSEARVDGGGVRRGTRRWRPKDRGRAVSFTRLASHIHISVGVE
jgi:large subunit ribosomal protein L22